LGRVVLLLGSITRGTFVFRYPTSKEKPCALTHVDSVITNALIEARHDSKLHRNL
jgi:hypothetical protein